MMNPSRLMKLLGVGLFGVLLAIAWFGPLAISPSLRTGFWLLWIPLMGLGSSLAFAYISGWAELAQQYRTTQSPPQTLHKWSYGKIGWVYFKGALNIGTTPTGLYLSVFPLMRFQHPPLLIPWSAVTQVEPQRFSFMAGYRLSLRSTSTILLLPQAALAEAEAILAQKR